MTCLHCAERIADLEAEVHQLKLELGLATEEREFAKLLRGLNWNGGRAFPAAARVILMLYRARGRPVHWVTLLDGVPTRSRKTEPLDRVDSNVRIWITTARKSAGYDAIETVSGVGYRITPKGAARVAAILEG